jgi:hypothetical protein
MYTLHPPTSQKTRDDSLHCACRAAKQPRYLAGWGLQRSLSQGGGKVGESGLGSRHQRTSDLTTSSTKPKRPSFNQVPCDISLDLSLAHRNTHRALCPPQALRPHARSSVRNLRTHHARDDWLHPSACPAVHARTGYAPGDRGAHRRCVWVLSCPVWFGLPPFSPSFHLAGVVACCMVVSSPNPAKPTRERLLALCLPVSFFGPLQMLAQ